MASLLCPGPFYHFIYDFGSYSFVSVSITYKELIGLELKGLTIDKYLSRIHPDDMEYFKKCELVAANSAGTASVSKSTHAGITRSAIVPSIKKGSAFNWN